MIRSFLINIISSYYNFKKSFERFKRVLEYLPLIWKDEDWDFMYTLVFIRYKLKRMTKEFEKNTITVNKRAVKQMNYAIFLIDRIENFYHYGVADELILDRWGVSRLRFKPTDDKKSSIIAMTYSKAQNDFEQLIADNFANECYKQAENKTNKDYDRLFKHFNRYIRKWLD